jgi:NADH-quinone oxidoreductase subunit G
VTAEATPKTTVTVTIDGKTVETAPGTLLIKAAQEAGVFIPRFCWHERMKPVGMCRMCLVEVEGVRGLPPACTTPVADGMVVHLQKENVEKAQHGVIEFLLINHPLDCPVCDRGGECPLQDQTLAFGPGESRFVEEKRHWEKPIPISDLVLLDRERCIQCARCTRFADEVAGDPLINFVDRAGHTEVNTFPNEPFSSYFSGNTVQICPVGALTASSYRFKARPWDLNEIETSCETCAVQCRGTLQSSSNRLVRFLGVDSEPVNQGWLCDKGRYGLDWVHRDDRVREPMVKRGGALTAVSWPEALHAASAELQRVIELHGPESVAVLGGARGTNEGAYAWARLAKGVLGTDNVDAQLGDGLPAELVLGLPGATIADADRAAAIVLLAPDLKEELPVLHLRLRRAAHDLGVPLIDISARDSGLTKHASAVLRHAPGEAGTTAAALAKALRGEASGNAYADAAAKLLEGRDGPIVVVIGRPSLAESDAAIVSAAASLRDVDGTSFLVTLRRANTRGALECGLAPGILPGRVSLDAGRGRYADAWGAAPATTGLDAEGIMRAAVAGKIHALVLLGTDPVSDCPDGNLARAAIDAVPFVLSVDCFTNASNRKADVFLPATVWGETTGTATNIEGRVQRLGAKISPEGVPMADWRIAAELAYHLGTDFDYANADEITNEIAAIAPAFAGVDAHLLLRAKDGVVLPLGAAVVELLDGQAAPIVTSSWDPILPSLTGRGVDLADLDESVEDTATADAVGTIRDSTAPKDAGASEDGPVVEADEAIQQAEIADRAELLVWDAAPGVVEAPGRDGYALRLVVDRKLYDLGGTAASSTNISGLAGESVLFVNRADRERIGVHDGERVRATSSRGTISVVVQSDNTTPVGVGHMVFAQAGDGPADLIELGALVTDVRVETMS